MTYRYMDPDGQPIGSVPVGTLVELYATGVLNRDSLVGKAGSEEWVPLRDVISIPAPLEQKDLQQPGASRNFAGTLLVLLVCTALGGGAWHYRERLQEMTIFGQAILAHPLGEWYEFGFSQGESIRAVHRLLELPSEAERSELSDILINLGVDLPLMEAEHLSICFEGFSDGVSGRKSRLRHPTGQGASILPEPLQGYHDFNGRKN